MYNMLCMDSLVVLKKTSNAFTWKKNISGFDWQSVYTYASGYQDYFLEAGAMVNFKLF